MQVVELSCELGGKTIKVQTGKMAKQAGGSVVIQSGDTMVLTVATSAAEPKSEVDFLPLTVEYLEKTFAAGKFPGGFFKREGRPSETAILTSRFIDRPIRPLFPDNYYFDTQVISTVFSADPECNPDTLAIIGASCALMISDIPLKKPIAGCRVGRINGQLCINPGIYEMADSDIELIVASSRDAVVMVEGNCQEMSEAELIEAIRFAHDALQPVIAMQFELQKLAGKPKRAVPELEKSPEITKAVAAVTDKVKQALAIRVKHERYGTLNAIKKELKEALITKETPYALKLQLNEEFEGLKSKLMRGDIVDKNTRIDGRNSKEIRPITCEVGLLPRAHGSALFTRGETQAAVAITLGTADDKTRIDGLLDEYTKNFVLHYNFPAFSVGEVKPLRSPGRREIGHGHLAENALLRVMPGEKDFPYSVRVVSEILESNGSSSMASVCGGSLSLMDAGVPIINPVAGIAMGLIKEENKYAILSDILGDEDHLGDMDFKVCGTKNGVTAIQMDIKIEGLTTEIMKEALDQAREGRLHILGIMDKAMPAPRENLSKHAPKVYTLQIPVDKIRDVIGSGGKTIKSIIEETGSKIDIEDDGKVSIFASDEDRMQQTIKLVQMYSGEVEIGKVYNGIVKKILEFGAFVEIMPKTDALLHISQIAEGHVKNVRDYMKEGDRVSVKAYDRDPSGKIKLTMKGIPQQENF